MAETEKTENNQKYRMVALSPEVYERIRRLAFEEHIPHGELVSKAIAAYEREGVKDASLPVQKS